MAQTKAHQTAGNSTLGSAPSPTEGGTAARSARRRTEAKPGWWKELRSYWQAAGPAYRKAAERSLRNAAEQSNPTPLMAALDAMMALYMMPIAAVGVIIEAILGRPLKPVEVRIAALQMLVAVEEFDVAEIIKDACPPS